MTHALFLDTMVYLHYKPVEHIDWHEVLNVPRTDEVLIVVPGITLREIDHHKNHTPRLQGRAQRVAAQLETWIASGTSGIRPGVRVIPALHAPTIDFDADGFDRGVNDDVLVAAALEYQRTNAGVAVVVVTQDSYPRLIARGRGLAVQALSDDLKLPAEADSLEKENRELRRQIQQMQSARPVLTLEFASDSKQSLTVIIPSVRPLTQGELAAAVKAMEQKYPPADSFRERPASAQPDTASPTAASSSALPGGLQAMLREAAREAEIQGRVLGPVSDREIERYADARSSFLENYAEYVQAMREFERARARRFTLELQLVNSGSVPATDVDVRIHVPDGVIVADEDDELGEPEAPKPPVRPQRGQGGLFAGLIGPLHLNDAFRVRDASYLSSHTPSRAYGPFSVSSWDIEETGSYVVSGNVGRVKHGLREALSTIYLTIPEDARIRPFQLTYSLHAANLPEAVNGTLTVLLKPGDADR